MGHRYFVAIKRLIIRRKMGLTDPAATDARRISNVDYSNSVGLTNQQRTR